MKETLSNEEVRDLCEKKIRSKKKTKDDPILILLMQMKKNLYQNRMNLSSCSHCWLYDDLATNHSSNDDDD